MPSAYVPATEGLTMYVKRANGLVPAITSPWAGDVVLGTWDPVNEWYEFIVLEDFDYLVYIQVGDDPTDEDTEVGRLAEEVADMQEIIDGVLAGLSGIEPKIVSNYDARKRLITLTAGNDLSAENGTQVDVRVNLPAGIDGEECTAYFGATKIDDASVKIQAEVSLVKIGNLWHVRIELTSDQMTVAAGDYEWDALVVDSEPRKVTVVKGRMEVAPDHAKLLPVGDPGPTPP